LYVLSCELTGKLLEIKACSGIFIRYVYRTTLFFVDIFYLDFGCCDSSEHQERLVPYPSNTMVDWKMKYFIKKKKWNDRNEYFLLKRVCPCCKDLETEYEKELRKSLEKELASRLKIRQEYFLKHGEEKPDDNMNYTKRLQNILAKGLRQSGYVEWLTG